LDRSGELVKLTG
jgi:hypothetical protein